MWIPASAAEVNHALAAGFLQETIVFDGKEVLPDPRNPHKSFEIASDVAAFANTNGGVLLYGVGEDANKAITRSTPILLAGAAERIDQVVRTGVAETPSFAFRPLPLDSTPGKGYLAVIIPPSVRAPHMVVADNVCRYYGRGPTGNRLLTEAEVARLYERRLREAGDREALFVQTVETAALHWRKDPALAYLYVHVQPALIASSFLDQALPEDEAQRLNSLRSLIIEARSAFPEGRFGPDLIPAYDWESRGTGWRTGPRLTRPQLESAMTSIVDLEIHPDGSALVFCGNAGWTDNDGRFQLNEDLIAGLPTRTFALLGALYSTGRYFGAVNVGVAVLGLQGREEVWSAAGLRLRLSLRPPVSFREDYYRTEQVSMSELAGASQAISRKLVWPLLRATLRDYDPFTERARE